MKTTYIFIVFVIVSLVQIAVPFKMITDSEKTIKSGIAYKFKTRPIDPTDPFRGKYITLDYEMNSFEKNEDDVCEEGDEVYVYLKNDNNGFAEVSQISSEHLDVKEDYVKAEVKYCYANSVRFELPFNKFYMEETKAYDAELAYRKANRDSITNNIYALVYVDGDKAVLQNVLVNDVPIQEYVEK